ncbi:transporter [Halorubrum ejinorense]|uniref:Transporter n=1 Tax=Halorubrum ejinorense TaxID=425309 RepID=A0AAV3SRH8_9EURY
MSSSTPGTAAANGTDSSLTTNAVGGAVAGAAAYVLGYLFVYVTQSDQVEEGLSGINFFADLFGGDPISVWRGVGWLFYNAHFVDVSVPSLIGAARSVNFVSQADGGAYLFVVPPVLLVLAGLAAGRVAGASTPVDGARAGALLTAGYLPLAVVGGFLFRVSVGDGATVAPDMITTVLLAGAVYPVAFGAIGGAVSSVLSD